MKNQREIYEALLAGKKLKHIGGLIIFLKEDGQLNHVWRFGVPGDWSIYEKPKKKVTVYEVIYQDDQGLLYKPDRIFRDETDVKKHLLAFNWELIKLIPIEIEIDQ